MRLTLLLLICFLSSIGKNNAQLASNLFNNNSELLVEYDGSIGLYYEYNNTLGLETKLIANAFHTTFDEMYTYVDEYGMEDPNYALIPFSKKGFITSYKPEIKQLIPVYYKVRPKDNIYRISKIYFGQDIEKMMMRNNLNSINLDIGHKLHVGWFVPNRKTDIPQALTEATFEKYFGDPTDLEVKNEMFADTILNTATEEMKSLVGIAYCERSNSDHQNMFALHRDAKENTIIELYYPHTNRKAYAKVIGKINPALYPDNINVIVSPKVAEALGALDQRFEIQMRYY